MSRTHVNGDSASPLRQPRRTRHANLSFTTPPAVESDVALWPAWTTISVEDLDLDDFDDRGFPLPRHLGGR